MLVYIVRHGESEGNRRGVLQGWLDEPLTDKGRALAAVTAEGLADVRFDAAFSSPLIRAYETCRIILDANRHPAPEIIPDDRLKEICFGSWEGLSIKKDCFQLPTDNFNLFYSDPFRLPNTYAGETAADVCARTGAFWRELTADTGREDQTVLIAAHGFALRCLLRQVYTDTSDFWHGRVPPNCAVNIVEVRGGTPRLLADDLLFYDPALVSNPFRPL